MTTSTSAAFQDEIVQTVAHLGEASIEEIEAALPRSVPRRTLQRRLALLVTGQRLIVQGRGRASRYVLPLVGQGSAVPTPEVSNTTTGLPLTGAAEAVRNAVRAPVYLRKPVGYQREFLDSYRPNRTQYLPQNLRDELASLGQTPGGELPAGTYARQILDRLLIDLSWNSSRLEGNTYSLLETERLLEYGESAAGKNAQDAQMILNHKAAIEMLVDDAAQIGFNRYTVLNLHALLSDNLLSNPEAGGRLRIIPVAIGGTVFHPLEVPQLVSECFDQILVKAEEIRGPFEQAFFMMVQLPYLQPFEDVNKRVSRLAANIPLIRLNLCPLSFVDVPERDYIEGILAVHELNRVELLREVFAWAYRRSCDRYAAVRRSLGEPDPFRLRYRGQLIEAVGNVIRSAMARPNAEAQLRSKLGALPSEDRERFVQVALTELESLHEGNFARFRVRPSEFERWREQW